MRVVFAVTAHGFGHATRSAALLRALRKALPDARLEALTDAPARFFPGVEKRPGLPDPGMVQRGPLDVDWDASLAAHEALAARWDAALAEARAAVRGASLVLADATALACAAAAAEGAPCFLVTNFTWDWILEGAPDAARGARAAARLADAYRSASGAFRLPGSGGFGTVKDVAEAPLVAARSALSRAEARRVLGVPDDGRRLLLVSFGGFGGEPPPLGRGWDGWRLAGFGPAPKGLDAPWLALDPASPRPHAEVVACADAVLCKPGYSTFAEAAAHGTRALYVHRPDYPEARALAAWLPSAVACRELPRGDFEAGRWRDALEELMRLPERPLPPPDGAERLAARLAALAPA